MKYKEPEIIIPALEAETKVYARGWTEKQDRILRRYYNKVPARSLVSPVSEHGPPKTLHSIQQRAYIMGLTHGKR